MAIVGAKKAATIMAIRTNINAIISPVVEIPLATLVLTFVTAAAAAAKTAVKATKAGMIIAKRYGQYLK